MQQITGWLVQTRHEIHGPFPSGDAAGRYIEAHHGVLAGPLNILTMYGPREMPRERSVSDTMREQYEKLRRS